MGCLLKFKALVVEKDSDGSFNRRIKEKSISDLDDAGLLVRVEYSSLNYKDALSATGHPGVTRFFPHTPGIDAAGEVVGSSSKAFAKGDKVIITGYDLGMETDGGWGGYIRVPAQWVVKLPVGITSREAMGIGTAGFTAALSVNALINAKIKPEDGDILVTGSTGGVGSIAVSILAQAGFKVTASTGKTSDEEYLKNLGANEVVSREEIIKGNDRPLLKERWSGVIDVAGGETLSAALKSARYGGVVTCCGVVNSPELQTNVYPFILRGVSLQGIDSVNYPSTLRPAIWEKLSREWKPELLEQMITEVTIDTLEEKIHLMLDGKTKGRIVVRHD